MRIGSTSIMGLVSCLCFVSGSGGLVDGGNARLVGDQSVAEVNVAMIATGTFDVKLTPQSTVEPALGRMSIAKELHGDLEGTSTGEMLTAMTGVDGSAGYVAIERVAGTLHGRRGTFVLQHSGTMTRGAQHLIITVVPDSGSGDLTGLQGRMKITISDGVHSYEFEYTLVAAP